MRLIIDAKRLENGTAVINAYVESDADVDDKLSKGLSTFAGATIEHFGAENNSYLIKACDALASVFTQMSENLVVKAHEKEMEFKHCKLCNHPYDKGDVFCARCGTVR